MLEGAHFRMVRSMRNLKATILMKPKPPCCKLWPPNHCRALESKKVKVDRTCFRRGPEDFSRLAVLRELEDPSSCWIKLVKKDCETIGLPFSNLIKLAMDRNAFRRVTNVL